MRKLLVTLLAAGAFSAVAQAQTPSWSGFKAGLSLDALNYTTTWTDTSYDWFGGSLSYSKRKIAPAIHVGWDTQVGSMVYGVELEHTFASAKRDVVYDTAVNQTNPRVLIQNELKSVTTLRGRMGIAVNDGLIYATAGFAKAKADHAFINNSYAPDTFPAFSNDHMGFVYGFGVEQRLSQLLSLRAEYQHVNIPETIAHNSPTAYYSSMEVGESVDTFNFGASFHF